MDRHTARSIPPRAGVGLKPEHYRTILDTRPDIGFFEIHAENYMGAGGPPHRYLEAVRRDYPISLHGVGLSIGGAGPLDRDHLRRLRTLVERYEPGLFSEHLAWSTHDMDYLPDLLPLPLNAETLATVVDHIDEVQASVGMRILLENPSTYLAFDASEIPEVEFLAEVARRTGCGLLLDVNNVEVSAVNHGFDATDYLNVFPVEHVGEIHLGGHDEASDDAGHRLLIDAHGSATAPRVLDLYALALKRCGPVPTLIEWDNDVPSWPELQAEAARAERILDTERGRRNRSAGVHVELA